MSVGKRYDRIGNPIGRTRVRLAEMLTTAFREQLGLEVVISPENLRSGKDWGDCWFGTFWREMAWGGYRAVVKSDDTMGECVKHGITLTVVPARVGTSDGYKAISIVYTAEDKAAPADAVEARLGMTADGPRRAVRRGAETEVAA